METPCHERCHPWEWRGDKDPLPTPSQQGTATPQRQMSQECLSAHPARAGQGTPTSVGHRWHCRCRLPAVPHSWGAGSPLGVQPLPCVCSPPVQPPRGRVVPAAGTGQGLPAPLSGGRVQPDKESLLDSGSKQSIRWRAMGRGDKGRNPPLGSRPQLPKPGGGCATAIPSLHPQSQPRLSPARLDLNPPHSFVIPKAALITRAPGTAKPG